MIKDLVIGIDSSTSATKAVAWDKDGNLVAQERCSIPLLNPQPRHFEQDPTNWWASTSHALNALATRVDFDRVAALSIANQRETFGLFNASANAVCQGMVWLDERAVIEQEEFAQSFGADKVHQISGKHVDVIVPIYRMIWLQKNNPEAFARATQYADVHAYLSYRLTGKWTTSLASADPSGMLDMAAKTWSSELLDAAGISLDIMPGLAEPGHLIGDVTSEAAKQTGLAEGTPLIAGGGDGQCAACGIGVFEASTAYMNLGTAVVAGLYSPNYQISKAVRTEIAVSDTGYICETVLKSGTFLIDWFVDQLLGAPEQDRLELLGELEAEASDSPIGAGGVVSLPFWQGSMTPHWDSKARGVMAGLSGSSSRGDVYRALLEGIALDQAYALSEASKATKISIDKIVAIGGGSASQLLLQIVADSMNVPVFRSDVVEASSLGAAMCAAFGAGWYASLSDASEAMSQKDLGITSPDPARVAEYAKLREIYDDLWPLMRAWNARLWDFANGKNAS